MMLPLCFSGGYQITLGFVRNVDIEKQMRNVLPLHLQYRIAGNIPGNTNIIHLFSPSCWLNRQQKSNPWKSEIAAAQKESAR